MIRRYRRWRNRRRYADLTAAELLRRYRQGIVRGRWVR